MVSRRLDRFNPRILGVLVVGILAACIAVSENTFADTAVSRTKQTQVKNKPANSVAGAVRNRLTPGHEKMLTLLKEIADRTPEENTYFGDGLARQLREQLAVIPASAPAKDRWEIHFRAGEAELNLGNETEAIHQFTQARQLLIRSKREFPPNFFLWTNYRLGVAHMRCGETQNCCIRHTPESCVLPIQGGGIHTQQDGSRQAIVFFTEVLQNTTKQVSLHLKARWLLNIAYMTIGGYPEQVPKSYLIPPKAFESREKMPRFTNIAPHLGLDTFDLAGGAIADDFDNDGYLDVVVSTWDTLGQMRFFRNNQDGTFSEQTEQAGLVGLYGGLNLVQADYDNDGNVDILVLRGAWLHKNRTYPNSLLHNNGDGTFTDVTFEAGLGEVHYPTQTAGWADYDNDGDLDLYIGNEALKDFIAPCHLFRNNGDGSFTDVAAGAGVQNGGFTKAVVWGDYDGDRWPDLYVSNYAANNRLYRNNGDGTFTDLAKQLNINHPMRSFPAWFWDFDNDGALDLYVASFAEDLVPVAASYLGMPIEVETASLYHSDGRGGFVDVARQQNLTRFYPVMGSNFGDLDNDGFPDFYLGTGAPDYDTLMPNVMFRNQGGTGFSDVTYAGGFGHLQKGHAVVFADLDNDGDQDVFEQMGGFYPGDKFSNALFENPGFGNHFLAVELVGVQSNRSAIGARIHVQIIENESRRSIYRHVNSGGSFGANPLRQTIGLGKTSKIEALEILWPTTGITQTFHKVPLNQFIQIIEGEAQYATLTLEKLELGSDLRLSAAREGTTEDDDKKHRARLFYDEGMQAILRRDYKDALAGFKRAVTLDPSLADAHYRLALLYGRQDYGKQYQWKQAVQALQNAIAADPNHIDAHYQLGEIYLEAMARTADAIPLLQKAIEMNPNYASARRLLGSAYLRQRHTDAAIHELQRAVAFNPSDPKNHYTLGLAYFRGGEFEKAIQHFKTVIERDAFHAKAHFHLGNAYLRMGQTAEGRVALQTFEKLNQEEAQIKTIKRSLRDNPVDVKKWNQLGRLLMERQEWEAAVDAFENCIGLDPQGTRNYEALGYLYLQLKAYRKTLEIYNQLIQYHPDVAAYRNSLGLAYAMMEKYPQAIEAFQTAIQLKPSEPSFYLNLAKTYGRVGDGANAEVGYRLYQRLKSDNEWR